MGARFGSFECGSLSLSLSVTNLGSFLLMVLNWKESDVCACVRARVCVCVFQLLEAAYMSWLLTTSLISASVITFSSDFDLPALLL